MSESDELRSLIFKRTLHVPIIKKNLFNAIEKELHKRFPPIIIEPFLFSQFAWKSHPTDGYVNFFLDHEYFYIRQKLSLTEAPQLRKCEKLRAEYKKNCKKIIDDTPSYMANGYPINLHIDILKNDESGCDIEIECHPVLYYNILEKKAKIDDLEKEHALLSCERFLKTLARGLKAKEIDRAESDLTKFTSFLGIDRNWMSATCALQLQEVSIFLVAKEKGISLEIKNVERILKRKKNKNESTFDMQYKAFAKEVDHLYNIKIPSLAMWLRKMRQAVLHEAQIPTKKEKELAISATLDLLKELKKVYELEKVTNNGTSMPK